MSETALKNYFVAFIAVGNARDVAANVEFFLAHAEDVGHAHEQCLAAEPGRFIIGAWLAEGVVGQTKKYSVLVTRDTTEFAVIEVEAEDKEDALFKATAQADEDPTVGWCRNEPGLDNSAYANIDGVDEIVD